MKQQLRVFYHVFRKTYRRRQSPRRIQMRKARRRKAVQRSRRQKTALLIEGAEKRQRRRKEP